MDGRPFSRDRSRVENPQQEPGPARRAISKRPLLRPSLAGRRSRGPEGETRRLLLRPASRESPSRRREKSQKKPARRLVFRPKYSCETQNAAQARQAEELTRLTR